MRSESSPAADGVCAIVVTFHPDSGLTERLQRVAAQVSATFVIDNGSNEASAGMLRDLSTWPGVTLISNGENVGIARALNIGVEQALSRGFSWALLLDQDSHVEENMIERLRATRDSFPAIARLAVIGARFRDTSGRAIETTKLESTGSLWQEVESVITSGSFLSLAAYGAIGPFRNEFFIDYVDTEYCYRARALGFKIIETREPLMSHSIGAQTLHRVGWSAKWTTNHSADRRYYIARNNTVLLREYGTSHGGSWRFKSVMRCWRLCKRIAFFEEDKLAKIRAVAQGWWDGMNGKMGPRNR
jgi:rhamnosyltransferase